MANDLREYQTKNLIKAIQSVTLGEGKAKETGNPYNYLEFTFVNGYSRRMFLNNDSLFGIKDALDQAELDDLFE